MDASSNPIIAALPEINAGFNFASGVLLTLGRVSIAMGNRARHRALMIAAFVCSSLFLAGYLTRAVVSGPKRFEGHAPWLRDAYLALLGSHMLLAVAVPPLAIAALVLGLRGNFATHKRVVRFAWPVWMYVSVTGVIVYGMLYHL